MTTAEKKPSQFRSKYKAMVVVVRHGHDILHPVTGTKVDEVKRLAAEFGVHNGEYRTTDPETGEERVQADIRGYFYDLDSDAEQKGWSEDEKEAVRTHLIRKASQNPDYVQIYEIPKSPAPWPTYDTTHHNKIPVLASELGLVAEAIQYERENKNRASVIADLEKHLTQGAEQVEELTAA